METMAMRSLRDDRFRSALGCWCSPSSPCPTFGCYNPPVDVSQTPAPFRFRAPKGEELSGNWSKTRSPAASSSRCTAAICHNARAIGERPFSNYQNVLAHMRVRALMTGEEQAKIEAFFRRWHDVPPASGPIEPSPKRQIFSQPIPELREESQAADKAAAKAKADEEAAGRGHESEPVARVRGRRRHALMILVA